MFACFHAAEDVYDQCYGGIMNHIEKAVAIRKLYYTVKDDSYDDLKAFSIIISQPYKVDSLKSNVKLDQVCFACDISIEGLNNEKGIVKYGVDAVQVLNIATNLESLIKQLSKKYDVYWEEGEPYFG